jgi:hypothetical protein
VFVETTHPNRVIRITNNIMDSSKCDILKSNNPDEVQKNIGVTTSKHLLSKHWKRGKLNKLGKLFYGN